MPRLSGALGSGLVIFSRFPIVTCSVYPYSLNGAPLDVKAGDWFVGKAAVSVVVDHPVLGHVQIFNTHVCHYTSSPACNLFLTIRSSLQKVEKKALNTIEPIVLSMHGNSRN